MNSSTGQRAAATAAALVSGLFHRRTRYRQAIEQELVALASLVLAVTCSARGILAKVPAGAERQSLLLACEQLARAAGAVVDPRSDVQHWSESGVEDAIHAFVAHHEQSADVRAAALEIARKHAPASRAHRRSSGNAGASGAQSLPVAAGRGGIRSRLLPMRTRAGVRTASAAVSSLGALWQSIARSLEGRSRTRSTGA